MMTLNNMDKGFEAYNLYLSLRAHFHGGTGKNFDITKGYKKVRTSYETYKNKGSISSMFRVLTDRYDYDTVHDIIVSNFANGDKYGGMPFDSNAMDVYKDWLSRKNKRSYQFEQDLNSIYDRMQQDNIEDCTVDSGHPLIIKMLLGKQIALETVVILNRELNFIDEYKDDLILKDTCLTVIKYTPFLEQSTKKMYLKYQTLINKIATKRFSGSKQSGSLYPLGDKGQLNTT